MDKYLNRLAAITPAPGGGSAAALVGATGMSLLSMVVRYVAKKKDNRASRNKLSKILDFTENSRRRLQKLMIEDEVAYLRLSKGRKLNKKNLMTLYKDAALAPLEACKIIYKGMMKGEEVSLYCKTSVASDLAEAALILEAGFLSAKLNVDINLKSMKASIYKKKIKSSLSRWGREVVKTKDRIFKKIKYV